MSIKPQWGPTLGAILGSVSDKPCISCIASKELGNFRVHMERKERHPSHQKEEWWSYEL